MEEENRRETTDAVPTHTPEHQPTPDVHGETEPKGHHARTETVAISVPPAADFI